MSEPAGPSAPVSAAHPGAHPPAAPSIQLQYAIPKPREPWGPDHPFLRVIRQFVFAVGLSLLLFGLTSAIADVYTRDAPYYAAWGAGFVGLATPLWRVKKDAD